MSLAQAQVIDYIHDDGQYAKIHGTAMSQNLQEFCGQNAKLNHSKVMSIHLIIMVTLGV